ncbi:MAG TPA: dynamin family protein [Micromonosporaceae bacterium]
MGESGTSGTPLAAALGNMRAAVNGATFPLAVPSAAEASRAAGRIAKQLDDYLLPRVNRLDAPLLVVVGGSTGAGKSTLLNSIVRAPVSAASVLRPTTRAPVLVSNPQDTAWFADRKILPGLTRVNASRNDHGSMQVVSAPALRPGLALLDAPDIDSVVDANRDLANQLLAAADLWLFVTTAARYADAVPWNVLRVARNRGTVLAIVLNRVPPGAEGEIAAHLREMLVERDLGDTTLFVLPETSVDGSGLLPEGLVSPLRDWLAKLANDATARAEVIRTTVGGAVRGVVVDVDVLAQAADEQTRAWTALATDVKTSYDDAFNAIAHGVQDGALLRGEVLARWQEFVGTGDLMRALQARIGKLRDRVTTALTGRTPPGGDLREALTSGVSALIQSNTAEAAERTAEAWRANPAGAPLVTDALGRPGPDLPARAERLIRDWQRGVFELVQEQGAKKRRMARVGAYTVNATGLLVMVGVFASTAFIPTGAEVGVAAGTTLAGQKLLEAVFGDEALRQLAKVAREDLMKRVRALLDEEAARYDAVRASIKLDPHQPERLRIAAQSVSHLAPATPGTPSLPAAPPPPIAAPEPMPALPGPGEQ